MLLNGSCTCREELEAISKVKNTLNNIHSAEEKRVEDPQRGWKVLAMTSKNMASQHQM